MSGMLPRPEENMRRHLRFFGRRRSQNCSGRAGVEAVLPEHCRIGTPVEQYRGSVHLCRYSAALRSEKHLLVFQYTALSLKVP